jgi:hypothetical protein
MWHILGAHSPIAGPPLDVASLYRGSIERLHVTLRWVDLRIPRLLNTKL